MDATRLSAIGIEGDGSGCRGWIGFLRFSQVSAALHIVLLSSCCVAATPRIRPLGLRRRAHARPLARSSLVVDRERRLTRIY